MYYVKEEEAIKNFYNQLPTGDRQITSKIQGIGDKKADKILDGLERKKTYTEQYWKYTNTIVTIYWNKEDMDTKEKEEL